MDDISQRLRMTPQEQRAATVVGRTLLGGMGIALLYFLGPALLAATWTLGILPVLGGIMATIVAGFFATQSETGQKFGSLLHSTFLVLFTKILRSFIQPDSEEDETDDEEEADSEPEWEEDPVAKTQAAIDRLRRKYQDALDQQDQVARFIAECTRTRDRFAADAASQQEQSLAADDRGEAREALRLVQKAAINQEHAQAFTAFIQSMEAFHGNLQRMSDQLDLDIAKIVGALQLQTAELRGLDLREEAAETHFGNDGNGSKIEAEAQRRLLELSAVAELRAASFEAHMSTASATLARMNIRNIAGSRQAVDALSDSFGTLESLQLPDQREAALVPPAVSAAPTSPGDTGESPDDRRSRIRKALGARTHTKKSL